jgi:TonB family protein
MREALLGVVLLCTGFSAGYYQGEQISAQTAPLKSISRPIVPYPDDARRKGIEGKVALRIVVDKKGNVVQAQALSGPEELVPAALASVRMWKFEPPASAPVTKTAEISFGFPKPGPGPESDSGEVSFRWGLIDSGGKIVAVADDERSPGPRYPEKERKSGVKGKMVLSVSLNPDGYVKDTHIVNSLSPALDKAVMDTVRPMKFKRIAKDPNGPLDDLRLQFIFRPICNPHF